MNRIKLLLLLLFVILNGDKITATCKDYKHEECILNGWKFIDESKEEALENYTKAKKYIDKKEFVKSYDHIVKARNIIKDEQTLKTKMKKIIYSGSALRPRQKIYRTEIKNTYNIKSLELNASSKNTAQPLLIIECSNENNNIYLYNLNKSFTDNKKIHNMDLSDIVVTINDKNYNIGDIKSGDKGVVPLNINKCQKLQTSLNAINSLNKEKSISEVKLLKKEK